MPVPSLASSCLMQEAGFVKLYGRAKPKPVPSLASSLSNAGGRLCETIWEGQAHACS